MRAKANYTSLGLMFVHPYLSNPEACFGFSSFEKQTTNKDHENQLGNLSFFFFCCRKHFIFHTHTKKKNRCIFFFLMFRARGKKLYVISLLKKRGRKEKCNFGKKTILSSFLFPSPMVPLSPSNTLKGCCILSLASFEGNGLDCIQSNMYPEPISYPAFSFFLLRWDWENTGRTKKVEKFKNQNDKKLNC